jgi:hypothetical protein
MGELVVGGLTYADAWFGVLVLLIVVVLGLRLIGVGE